jgi:hypothetical protein
METITIEKRDGRAETSQDIGLAIGLLRNGTYTLTIKRQRESSAAQIRLLWMWVNAIARETGDKADDIYKWLCHELLPHEVTVMGRRVTVDGNPKDLRKEQMTAFLDLVRSWVRATTGIRLPLPEDRIFDEFSKRYG